MSLYFFDIQDGEALPDPQGLELRDAAEAQAYALEVAMTFLRQEKIDPDRDYFWSVSIRAEGSVCRQISLRISGSKNT